MSFKSKILMSTTSCLPLSCSDFSLDVSTTTQDEGLTDEEIENGFFLDSVLGKCDLAKTIKDRNKAMEKEDEAFSRIYNGDGILIKSNSSL